jgi:hypothetical protein
MPQRHLRVLGYIFAKSVNHLTLRPAHSPFPANAIQFCFNLIHSCFSFAITGHVMRRTLTFLATAFLSSILALANLGPAQAGAQISPSFSSASKSSSSLLQLAGYYSDSQSYEDNDSVYGDNDDGEGYQHRYKRTYHSKRYYDNQGDDYRHRSCGYKRWKRKYVCEEPEPRCFKQRECIWHYGREYCTYVRKCVGGQQYCHWKSVPVRSYCGNNGYDD